MPETKEGSYQAANAWWQFKLSEIKGQQPPHPHAAYLDNLARRRDLVRHDGRQDIAAMLSGEITRIQGGGTPDYLAMPILPEQPPPDASYGDGDEEPPSDFLEQSIVQNEMASAIDPFDQVWSYRVARANAAPVPDERTIGDQVRRYLELERSRVGDRPGQISRSEYDLIRLCLTAFRDWAGPELPIDTLTADKWEQWWEYLLNWQRSIEYKKKMLRHARNLIQWLASKGLINLPPNINSQRYRFGSGIQAVPTLTREEVRRLVDTAPDPLRLYLLLMINTGMQQQDISDLKREEVRWAEGRIIRRRSKTRHNHNPPTVSYKLWPVTWELLQRFCQPTGDRVFLTDKGEPLVRDWLDADGKRGKSDSIDSMYNNLQRRLKYTKPLKLLRKTSATQIESHREYGRSVPHFLGNTPSGVTAIHYAAPSGSLFDEIVEWLGRWYGYVD